MEHDRGWTCVVILKFVVSVTLTSPQWDPEVKVK